MNLINLAPGDLEAFVSVAETGSFRGSARLLGISQPAVSARIQHLEAVLGVRLFDRTTRRVVLTRSGERLLGRVERLVMETRELVREFRDEAGLKRGRLVLGASPSVAAAFLPGVIGRFRERWPDIDVELHDDFFGRLLDRIHRGEVDMAVIPFDPNDDSLAFEPLIADRFRLAVSTRHPLAGRAGVSLAEIDPDKLMSMPPESATWATLRRAFEDAGLAFRPGFQSRNALTILSLIRHDVGIGIVTEMFASVLGLEGITLLPIRDADLTRRIGIVSARDHQPTPAAQAMRKLLRESARQYPSRDG